MLDGTAAEVVPELGRRIDGAPLLYRGKEHSVGGEPESGKTWFVLMLVAQVLDDGGRVVIVDFEDSAPVVVGRLLGMGVDREVLRDGAGRFRYIRPDAPPGAGEVGEILTWRSADGAVVSADLLVLDGYTEGASVLGKDVMSQTDIAAFRQILVRPALDRGCATVVTDHVVKDKTTRGRYVIGAQHKLAGLTGAQFLIEVRQTWGKAQRGVSRVLVTKDRNGNLRPYGQPGDEPNVTYLGDLIGDATAGMPVPVLLAPQPEEENPVPPLRLVADVLGFVAECLTPPSGNQVERGIPWKAERTRTAILYTESKGWTERIMGPRNARLLHLTEAGSAFLSEMTAVVPKD